VRIIFQLVSIHGGQEIKPVFHGGHVLIHRIVLDDPLIDECACLV
jgi:hypothetical protein